MAIVVITGTNTDVGKTYTTASVARSAIEQGVRVTVCKPAQTGEPAGSGDLSTVQKLLGVDAVHDYVEFARYPEPLAPNISARRAGMAQLNLDETARRIRELDAPGELVLVEGAGGLLVRIAEEWTIADLAAKLCAPILVVTSTGLGSLNCAELTVEAAQRRGIEVVGLIGGIYPDDPDLATRLNVEEFEAVCGVPLLGLVPQGQAALADDSRVVQMLSGLLATTK